MEFRSERFELFLYLYKLSRNLLPSLESVGFSVQEKKCEIDFQDELLLCRLYWTLGLTIARSRGIFYNQSKVLSWRFSINFGDAAEKLYLGHE